MILEFLDDIRKDLKSRSIKLYLVNAPAIYCDGSSCSGYFSDEDKALVVAVQLDNWIEILAHEYCHSLQSQEKKWNSKVSDNHFSRFNNWLYYIEELSEEQLIQSCKFIQECELDCERRTIDLLSQYNLLRDPVNYIQQANAYIAFYEAVRQLRIWDTKIKLEDNKELLDLIPTTLYSKVDEVTPEVVDCIKRVNFSLA